LLFDSMLCSHSHQQETISNSHIISFLEALKIMKYPQQQGTKRKQNK
jgi:hypothetical protein